MLDERAFAELVKEIEALGYERSVAGRYAVEIGDTPVIDEQGNVLIIQGDKIVARLKGLSRFGKREQ